MKCYRHRLEALCNNKPDYHGKHGLFQVMMKRITHGARCATKMHSATGDVAALHHDLHNGPRHYFGLHSDCNSAFCQHKSNLSSGRVNYIIKLLIILYYIPQNHHCWTSFPPIFSMMLKQQAKRQLNYTMFQATT